MIINKIEIIQATEEEYAAFLRTIDFLKEVSKELTTSELAIKCDEAVDLLYEIHDKIL